MYIVYIYIKHFVLKNNDNTIHAIYDIFCRYQHDVDIHYLIQKHG